MISSVHIEGYRGFQRFDMNGLGRVNLLVGTNNSGKTSVLEAIHLLTTRGDPNLPQTLPAEGLIEENASGKRLGVWIMPDNVTDGDLEIFLRHLVPEGSKPLWDHAVQSTASAKGIGAPYNDCHCHKANLYTWLAWQDEPTQRQGEALTKKILDSHAPSATLFVKWFRQLYQL